MKSLKILVGAKEIMAFLGVSEPTFLKLREKGLPVRKVFGLLFAHTDNLEDFFKRATLEGPEIGGEDE